MKVALLMIVMATLGAANPVDKPTASVTLKQGDIMGVEEKTPSGRQYYFFRSIPYAEPPVGPLRFKDPQPAKAWSGVRNASIPFPKCPQVNMANGTIDGQEDCLYLNVYTPKVGSSALPVMVFIHGGGFVIGCAEDGSPTPLMQKDVVVVAMNYRLGPLGFLSTGDDILPGNLGLKDQVLALRWVKDNIADLGGDPSQVTIFGVSAGGVSVHLHVLSPSSAGLFQRAILQSGTALMASMFPEPRRGAIKFSKALNCTGEESQELLTCFTEASVEALMAAPAKLTEWFTLPKSEGVTVDGTFLPDHPAVLLEGGQFNHVDLMAGTTKDDGNIFTSVIFDTVGKKALQQLNDNFTRVAPFLLGFTEEEENPVYLSRRVFFNYLDDLNITEEDDLALTSLAGYSFFLAPNLQTVEFHAAKVPNKKTFLYQLDHEIDNSLVPSMMNVTQTRPMAGHGDDMLFLFTNPLMTFPSRPQDLYVQELFVELWTNFAATGNPTTNGTLGFKWSPVTPQEPLQYLSLSTRPAMYPVDEEEREFWNSLPTKANKILYPERFQM